MQKQIIIIVVIIILILGGVWYYNQKPTPVIGEPIKIGVILPLSGSTASTGEFAKNGIELAVADLEKEGKNVEVIFEDGKYDPAISVSAYNKLKTVDKVNAIFAFGTPAAMALSPLVNNDKTPLLAVVVASAYSTPNDFTFRVVGSAEYEAKFVSDVLINKLNKKRIAVMYLNNDYGKGAATTFKKFIGNQAAIVAEEGSLPEEADYRSQLTKIKAANPDAVFLATLFKEAGTIIKQAKELGINAQFVCGQPCENPEFVTTGGIATEGAIVVSPISTDSQGFNKLYLDKFGVRASYISLRSYDTIKVLAEAASRCVDNDYDGDCLRREIDGITDFPGLSYKINFDENGDINDQFKLSIIKNGQYVSYE